MSKKRDTYWDSRVPNLWLRNNVFYYRVELPRVDNKRRYKRLSLHTSNFYEAREKIRDMSGFETDFNRLSFLFNRLIVNANDQMGGVMTTTTTLTSYKLSKRATVDDVSELYALSKRLLREQKAHTKITREQEERLQFMSAQIQTLEKTIMDFLGPMHSFMAKSQASMTKPLPPARTISEVLESMILKANNCPTEQINKRNKITKLLNDVGLKIEDDYAEFHNSKVIEAISRNITQAGLKGDMQRRLVRFIKELATYGTNIDPDHYKSNVTSNLPKIDKTKKAEKSPYIAYTKAQLLEIFNPRYSYFKENPDAFFVCLIALFTGSRANGAVTLQYNDIITEDGLHCIQFIENHPLKQLKNEMSERTVPIHSQLIDVGFVDYVRRNEKRLNTTGTDFIFAKCKTKNGKYNNKYTVRSGLEFFKNIGVKTGSNDGLAFHSFRKNASLAL